MRVADNHEKLVVVPGLGDVVEATFLDRSDRGFNTRHRGNDDDGQCRIDSLDVLLDVHAGLPRQHQVQQNKVVEILFNLQ